MNESNTPGAPAAALQQPRATNELLGAIEQEFVALPDLPAFIRRLQDEVRAARAVTPEARECDDCAGSGKYSDGLACDVCKGAAPVSPAPAAELMEQPKASEPTIQQAHDMGAKGAVPSERERLLFEAWMRGHCWALCATWDGKQYLSDAEQGGEVDHRAMATRRLFAAWRDRAALAAVSPSQVPQGQDSGAETSEGGAQ